MHAPGGRARVEVNGGSRGFTAEKGRPLLFSLMAERIFIPSACGGRASCGQCRVRVLEGADGYAEKELPLISPAERERGVHLACQLPVRRDMKIEIPEGHLRALQHTASVLSLHDVAPDMREVILELREPPRMPFAAGQYVQFLLPGTETAAEPVYRAYSIASPPSSPGRLSLLFGLVPGGQCSGYVFQKLRAGDTVTVNGPFGDFGLRESGRDILLIAGGSGMAPMRSLLLDMAERGERRAVTFFFAARTAGDLFFLQDIRAVEQGLPGFRFVPVLSRPRPEEQWRGERGGIAAALARLLPALTRHEAYLCGNPGMIDACIGALRARGLSDERIFFDKFS
jgi:Na+-transporting NADH:ubiquinone oxidoreductase subunit F